MTITAQIAQVSAAIAELEAQLAVLVKLQTAVKRTRR